ncbi:RBBP9/YdeN family alpha/beta hydrolase [Tsukamurella ocularis]|uniref:RBBP9/YdeN family alpha/beta hydrolase n=1 Tax=Tsukamurella ocularis TaxID=1970234 RepID=UPI002167BC24|nr:alpha/beta hydrolase [Tsukamurella ocularis]MCS3780027.1 putative alpha/beta hydrolase family esterase [Tsukamurella ocularis]MCS3786419.1 putative alpha/beta hydrolase family esterase [Tsukamurella ocularis]MCS3849783.1 putative alpha/beta hydrolase family esterase [Tsukamurella ocularis]
MVSYVIVPGIDGSDDQHWQTFWEKEWGDLGVRIAPRSWSEPDLANWVDSVQDAFDEASVRDREVVLVAHSLGCWAVSEWLARNPAARVKAAFLAAPPDPLGSAFPRDAASTFVNVEARTLSCPSIVVASSNDPYCDLHTAARIAGAWGSDVQQVGAVGHINSASGLGAWPLGRGILATLANA